jgi:mRNA interferase RelE/StbE
MWTVSYTKRFLKELADLPDKLRTRVEMIVFQELETDNPFALGYIEKMTGYSDKYKIRVGEYRVGVTMDTKANTITCQRVANRKDIYKVFP